MPHSGEPSAPLWPIRMRDNFCCASLQAARLRRVRCPLVFESTELPHCPRRSTHRVRDTRVLASLGPTIMQRLATMSAELRRLAAERRRLVRQTATQRRMPAGLRRAALLVALLRDGDVAAAAAFMRRKRPEAIQEVDVCIETLRAEIDSMTPAQRDRLVAVPGNEADRKAVRELSCGSRRIPCTIGWGN